MRFKIWWENINRRTARDIVLDALGASSATTEQRGAVLGSQIKEHPDLMQKLTSYTELQPFISQITTFVETSANKTIQFLINFIDSLQ